MVTMPHRSWDVDGYKVTEEKYPDHLRADCLREGQRLFWVDCMVDPKSKLYDKDAPFIRTPIVLESGADDRLLESQIKMALGQMGHENVVYTKRRFAGAV